MDRPIVIIGAGISGLSLAWYLKQALGPTANLLILEKNSRVGGWIQTINKEGFLFELGPRSCRTVGTGAATIELCEELGLQDQMIHPSPNAKKRYLWNKGNLEELPNFFSAFFKKDCLLAVLKDLFTPKGEKEEESIYAFFSRRFGNEITEKYIDPFCSGIYAGDIKKLSLPSCFPNFYRWEQSESSVIKGMWRQKNEIPLNPFVQKVQKNSLFTFRNGMETLVTALKEALQPFVRLNCAVNEIVGNCVLTDCGKKFVAAHIFDTRPLKDVESATVAVISLGWKKDVLKRQGFGYLIPSRERNPILGAVWDSSAFPQHNRSHRETRMTIMMGGAHQPLADRTDFIPIAQELLRRQLSIFEEPDVSHVKLARCAIPQYNVGHRKKISTLLENSPRNVTLLGSSLHGVSINDCIDQARLNANQFIKSHCQ